MRAVSSPREERVDRNTMSTATTYTGKDIVVLEGLEPVRKRPSMYIGGVDKAGLHHLVWEIVDNAVDEYLNGYADAITVTLHKNGDAVTITDNGRGIPVDLHPRHKKPALELILTTLHSGAKFGDGDSYMHSGGLHGVGSSVVNALSRKLIATIRRDGFEWQQSFKRGKVASELQQLRPFRGHGTTIYFEPDPEIFKTTHFDAKLIREHLEDMSYIHSGLKITFENEATKESFDLSHPGGLPEFLGRLIVESQKPAVTEQAFTQTRNNGERMEVALQWTESTDESIRSFVNGIRTSSGGTHENGLKGAVVKAIRNYMETHEVKLKGLTISAEDVREGLVAILSVFVREPMFQGQTKEKLNNPEMTATVDNAVRPALEAWLNANKTAADQIVGRIVLAAKARLASREAVAEVKRKSVTSRRLNLPGKLADCKASERDDSELFIVEGDSAGGCFSGDTQVALADGRSLSFLELVAEQAAGKKHFCYTIRKDGKIGLERILHARRTKVDAEVVRVVLDNDEAIVCTPDHLFMLRDGSYRRAGELQCNDSLMPLYRKLSDMREPGITIEGYEMVWDPRSDYWLFTHILADWYNRHHGVYRQEDGDHCHHIDFEGDAANACAAVANYNHRVVRVERLLERRDVYDIEVPGTHNFALASGVFVHNSAKQGRNNRTQAVLPLRGKILNSEGLALNKVLSNAELNDLVTAIGTGAGEKFDLSGLRYGKVILLMDADADGKHITTLLLAFFFRHMTELVRKGRVFIAQPPLYRIDVGKETHWARDDAHKEEILASLRVSAKPEVSRFKGLGEMDPKVLAETTLDPRNRTLLQVHIDSNLETDKIFVDLLGKDPSQRQRFVMEKAPQAVMEELDV
jgi:DNA gyrase subunit B